MKNSVSECGVLHSIDNTSDHSPIFCDIKKKITSKIVGDDAKDEETRVRTHSLTDEEWRPFIMTLKKDWQASNVQNVLSVRFKTVLRRNTGSKLIDTSRRS